MTSVAPAATHKPGDSGKNGRTSPVDLCMPTCEGIKIEEFTIPQLQQYLSDGKFSARSLAECYLERIRRLNGTLKFVSAAFWLFLDCWSCAAAFRLLYTVFITISATALGLLLKRTPTP